MKLKKILFGVTGALALSFMLASCGNNDTTKNATNTTTKVVDTTTNSGVVVINYLSFINDNMIRVDIMNDLGVTFKYGEETVTSQGSLALNENSKLSYTGELTTDVSKVNVILVMDNDTGATVSVNQGVTSSRFLELLGRLPINGSKKVYVAISTGTPTWTKGLNAAMDTAIEGYITTK